DTIICKSNTDLDIPGFKVEGSYVLDSISDEINFFGDNRQTYEYVIVIDGIEWYIKPEYFYNKYGAKTIVIARFMPIVRTFAPILAGVGRMRYDMFVFYNIIGGALWSFGLSGLGYYLGSSIPNIDHYLLPIIAGIIFLSILPGIVHIARNKTYRDQIIQAIKHFL
ncbi:MAG: VTT domain-containing protein, partial [Patescibacteria group bacterium]